MSSESWIEVAEVARLLDSSRGAVRKAIARGTLAARPTGDAGSGTLRYLVRLDEVERYRRENLRPGHRRG